MTLRAWWMLSLSQITTITGARGSAWSSMPSRAMKSAAQRRLSRYTQAPVLTSSAPSTVTLRFLPGVRTSGRAPRSVQLARTCGSRFRCHAFLLQMMLERVDELTARVGEVTARIEEQVAPYARAVEQLRRRGSPYRHFPRQALPPHRAPARERRAIVAVGNSILTII